MSVAEWEWHDWVEETCETIADKYEKAGTALKGLKPIADALNSAREIGKNDTIPEKSL